MSVTFGQPLPGGNPLATGSANKGEGSRNLALGNVPVQDDGQFALLMAGLMGGNSAVGMSVATSQQAGVPAVEEAPAKTPASSGLPWDTLAAASEEAGRLAVAFQWPMPQQVQAAPAIQDTAPVLLPMAQAAVQPTAEEVMPSVAAPVTTPASETIRTSLAPALAEAGPSRTQIASSLSQLSQTSIDLPASPPLAENATQLHKTDATVLPLADAAAGQNTTATISLPQAPTAPQNMEVAVVAAASAAATTVAEIVTPQGTAVTRAVSNLRAVAQEKPVLLVADSVADAVETTLPDAVAAVSEALSAAALPLPQQGEKAASLDLKAADPVDAAATLAAASTQTPAARPLMSPQPLPSPHPAVPQRAQLAAEAAPQLVMRVAQAQKDGVDRISVDLRPPELGRVELQMTFRDGMVHVVMRAEQPETFEALRQERHHLEQQMADAGLQLGAGGLDLQQGRLPQPEPEAESRRQGPVFASEGETAAEETSSAGPRPPASDSLIDIIA
ncbi:flagellar hook-length control protein FliK [Teichococcus vastitatis]|uniref:Flagellar hook-length control protein FliK n=1 Tax=Teichococcus vastitatis TaxID=2307076 RepID=A0ABS9W6E9_9PROT|nr:flagellar hook-length control protein FliK [Pseudoroseomonas vastitatis]MCI0754798.1 flagellar hook-length control protein FliK [Pseudoroseomonas vastitatis]